MNVPQGLTEEDYTPSVNWFKLRLGCWLSIAAGLLGLAASIVPILGGLSLLLLVLLIVPASLVLRDTISYHSQQITLIYYSIAIRRGLFVTDNPNFNLFDVQFDYRQSWIGRWLNYGDVVFRYGKMSYRLYGIRNVRRLAHSIALRRAIVLRSVQQQSGLVLPP